MPSERQRRYRQQRRLHYDAVNDEKIEQARQAEEARERRRQTVIDQHRRERGETA